VFENRVLKRIFGLEREEVTAGWCRVHSEKRHDVYQLPKFIWVVKLRRLRWLGMWHA
jgi:hypothetical protein